MTAQPGIFALGTPEHAYLELDLRADADPTALLRALCGLDQGLSTTGGVNVVIGVRPELWAQLQPEQAPADAAGFTDDVVGPDGFRMPATQHDAWVWIAGGNRTAVFDNVRDVFDATAALTTVAGETSGWLYRHDRDLTGFIDGTENPSLLEAPSVAVVPAGEPAAGASIVLFQLWRHDTDGWSKLGERDQEAVMGRTKSESVEFDAEAMPASAHVARTSFSVDGEEQDIFRRNVAYGTATDHGTVFVGFARDQWRMAEMLRRMAGVGDGVRCALTRYTYPWTGAYYVVPSLDQLALYAPAVD
jgi:porphyrinogen peroxidase